MRSIDPEKLGQWFEAYGAKLVLFARQWLDLSLAEEIVQEVFIRLMTQQSEPENVKAWLFRSVRNGAISRLRSLSRAKKHHNRLVSESSGWFEPRIDDLIDSGEVQSNLIRLPV